MSDLIHARPRRWGHAALIVAISVVLGGVALLSLSGCMTTSPEEDPTQIKLNDVDNRLTRIERVMAQDPLRVIRVETVDHRVPLEYTLHLAAGHDAQGAR